MISEVPISGAQSVANNKENHHGNSINHDIMLIVTSDGNNNIYQNKDIDPGLSPDALDAVAAYVRLPGPVARTACL